MRTTAARIHNSGTEQSCHCALSWPEEAVSGLSAESTNPPRPPIYILSITVSHQWASFQKLTGQILSGQNMEWETGSDDNTCP